MHWFDVRDIYFDTYRENMEGFFKAPGDKIFRHRETKARKGYEKPYYSEEDKLHVDEESRKFMFKTDDDKRHCKRIVQGLSHSLVQVSFVFYIFSNYLQMDF